MTHKARRRWSLLLLTVSLPLYITAAFMGDAARFPRIVELIIYVLLFVAWAFPLVFVLSRRGWALFILIIGLPLYVVFAVTVMSEAARFSKPIEFFIYVVLGIAWAFPLKFVFKGIGQADPDADQNEG